MKNLTVALVGCGRIGKMHIENIISHYPQVHLKTVVTPIADWDWLEQRGIKVISQDLNSILSDQDIDAVIITTPSTEHVSIIKQVAEHGKHIFCEKPIGFQLAEILSAIEAVSEAGVILQVGFNRRFDSHFQKVQSSVQNGDIGEPHIIRITNRDPKRPDLSYVKKSGGMFLDFNIHDFDLLRFVTGHEVESVYAQGAALIDPQIQKLGDIDTAVINLTLDSGALCIIDSSREAVYGYDQRLEVFGSKGSVEANNVRPTATVVMDSNGQHIDKPYYSFVERYHDAFIAEFEAFFKTIQKELPSPVSGFDALKAVSIALAANVSLKENRRVTISEIHSTHSEYAETTNDEVSV